MTLCKAEVFSMYGQAEVQACLTTSHRVNTAPAILGWYSDSGTSVYVVDGDGVRSRLV